MFTNEIKINKLKPVFLTCSHRTLWKIKSLKLYHIVSISVAALALSNGSELEQSLACVSRKAGGNLCSVLPSSWILSARLALVQPVFGSKEGYRSAF